LRRFGAGRGQSELAEQRASHGLGAAAGGADGDAAGGQRGEAVRDRPAAIEDPQRLAIHRHHAPERAARIGHERIGPALDEGHIRPAAQQALGILEGPGGELELHPETFASEPALVSAAEGIVRPVGRAGGQHDAAGRERIHVAQAEATKAIVSTTATAQSVSRPFTGA
jgi:hypothetical protein